MKPQLWGYRLLRVFVTRFVKIAQVTHCGGGGGPWTKPATLLITLANSHQVTSSTPNAHGQDYVTELLILGPRHIPGTSGQFKFGTLIGRVQWATSVAS